MNDTTVAEPGKLPGCPLPAEMQGPESSVIQPILEDGWSPRQRMNAAVARRRAGGRRFSSASDSSGATHCAPNRPLAEVRSGARAASLSGVSTVCTSQRSKGGDNNARNRVVRSSIRRAVRMLDGLRPPARAAAMRILKSEANRFPARTSGLTWRVGIGEVHLLARIRKLSQILRGFAVSQTVRMFGGLRVRSKSQT